MNSSEIKKFLEDRYYYIGGDDFDYITDKKKHPEVIYVKELEHNIYELMDIEFNIFKFRKMPFEEAVSRGLVSTAKFFNSDHIRCFLEQRCYYIGKDDILDLISEETNPLLRHVKYSAFGSVYHIRQHDGEEFNFRAMDYEDAKGLVKKKKDK